jgi:hypothetical protein
MFGMMFASIKALANRVKELEAAHGQ